MTRVGSEEGQDFQVDSKAKIKGDYRGDIREYFNLFLCVSPHLAGCVTLELHMRESILII